MKRSLLIVSMLIFSLLVGGCIQLGTTTDSITGHVYMDGHVISGAHIEAISVNGISSVNTMTDNGGAYTLNINTKTVYNLTASWQGLSHMVGPVYLPGDINTYDINLTSVPTSTIEGSGYKTGTDNPEAFGHKRASGYKIGVIPVNGNTYIIAYTDSNGSYKLNVEPNVLYNMSFAYSGYNFSDVRNGYVSFYYRNVGPPITNITVGPNETDLVDYIIPVP